jgi:hypothetical protein
MSYGDRNLVSELKSKCCATSVLSHECRVLYQSFNSLGSPMIGEQCANQTYSPMTTPHKCVVYVCYHLHVGFYICDDCYLWNMCFCLHIVLRWLLEYSTVAIMSINRIIFKMSSSNALIAYVVIFPNELNETFWRLFFIGQGHKNLHLTRYRGHLIFV